MYSSVALSNQVYSVYICTNALMALLLHKC